MVMETFMVTGSRPPSALSSRPVSAKSTKKYDGYRTVSHSSNVDETLFGSTKKTDPSQTYAPHWSSPPKEKPKKTKPLFWAPEPTSTPKYKKPIIMSNSLKHTAKFSNTAKSKHSYKSHKPSFVDETLFGPKLVEPDFEAPWAEKKKKPPILFCMTDYTQDMSTDRSQKTELSTRPSSRTYCSPKSALSRPSSRADEKRPAWK